MKPRIAFLSAAFFWISAVAPGVIVDRVVISVGNRVITESEVELRLRLSAFQNGAKADITLASRREAAGRLLDQKLIEKEMDLGRYPRLSKEGNEQLLKDYAEQYFQSNVAEMGRALAAYSLAVRDLEDDLARQEDLLTFLSLRFRPGIQVSDDEIQTYFRTKTNGQIPLSELRPQIEKVITNERGDKELDLWLKDQRKRAHIEYQDKELAP